MFLKNRNEPLIMSRLQQVRHLMDDDVLKKILGLLHEFRIQPDVSRPVIAAAPLGLHSLQEVSSHFHIELSLPFLDERRDGLVKE